MLLSPRSARLNQNRAIRKVRQTRRAYDYKDAKSIRTRGRYNEDPFPVRGTSHLGKIVLRQRPGIPRQCITVDCGWDVLQDCIAGLRRLGRAIREDTTSFVLLLDQQNRPKAILRTVSLSAPGATGYLL